MTEKLSKSMKNALTELQTRGPGWHIASSLKANYRTLYALRVRGLAEYEHDLCEQWKLSEKGKNLNP